MSQDDVREITQEATTNKKRRFDARDWNHIAEYVTDTLQTRRKNREDREKAWKEIDRQVEMKPEISHKLNANGTPDPDNAWMPELELPLQAQTLEILTADARRMMFPDSGPWYESHALLSDEYLDRVDFQSLVSGDTTEVPTRIDQDAADKLVTGVLDHFHRQYDFFGNIDQINAEAFKYGLGIGRARMVTKRQFMNTAKGVVKIDQKMPVLVPVSVKNTYPDDSEHRLMNEGQFIGQSVIRQWRQLLSDVVIAAQRGGKDPNSQSGGWMPRSLSGVDAEPDGTVGLVEMEGDFIVSRKTTANVYIPNAVVTVLVGKKGKKAVHKVVRFRWWDRPFSSYVMFPYHQEHLDSAYPSSPLMKGRPIQMVAVDALSRMTEQAAINTQPPVGYDSDDQYLAQQGGPKVQPKAKWASVGDIKTYPVGDPTGMFQIYAGLLQQYADVTGINAPRLGAQTVSHTTAFAKEAELQRGTVRTVDYVRSALKGAMTQWLSMEYRMGRETIDEHTLYIDSYRGFVTVSKDDLPDEAVFEVHGSSGPQEEQAKQQQKLQSMQLALQLDQVAAQLGAQPSLLANMPQIIDQMLREGGWSDVDVLMQAEQQAATAAGSQLPGVLTQGVTGE